MVPFRGLLAALIVCIGSRAALAQWGPESPFTSAPGDVWGEGIAASGSVVHVVYGTNEVRYRSSPDEGATWSEDRPIDDGSLHLTDPIAADGEDVWVVVLKDIQNMTDWCCSRDLGNIYLLHSGNGGQDWDAARPLTTSALAFRVSIAYASGRLHLVWMDYRSGAWDTYYLRSTDRGLTWEPEKRIAISAGTFGAERPQVAARGDGVHVTIWDDRGTNPPCMAGPTFSFSSCPDTFYLGSTDGGVTWGSEVSVAYSGAAIAGRNDVAVAGSASVIINFNRSEENTADANPHMFVVRSGDDGATWGDPVQLTDTPGSSDHGSIIGDGSNVHLAWHDSRDGSLAIYYRRSADEGTSWTEEELVSTATGTDASTPLLAVTTGYLHALWLDHRSGSYQIYYRRRAVDQAPPQPDAGPGGGGTTDGGSTPGSDGSGCGCRIASRGPSSSWPLVVLAILGILLARRSVRRVTPALLVLAACDRLLGIEEGRPWPADASTCGGAGQPCCAGGACGTDLACTGEVCTCVAEVSAGGEHSCVRTLAGAVLCWGGNGSGQLGDGTPVTRATPTEVVDLQAVVGLGAGRDHTCAVRDDPARPVACFGANGSGELGDGTTLASSRPVDVAVPAGTWRHVGPGVGNTCAVRDDGTVWCWGDGVSAPAQMSALADVRDLASGQGFHCAVLGNGEVWCWGRGVEGELGDGLSMDQSTPVRAGTLAGMEEITAGHWHACARGAAEVWCWGYNNFGQLGLGDTNQRAVPVQVTLPEAAVGITAGMIHTCALLQGGAIECWGSNVFGALGDRTTNDSSLPVAVVGPPSGSVEVEAGGLSTCARVSDGHVECWGAGTVGQLGDATFEHSDRPVRVVEVTGAEEIAIGFSHGCARISGGTVRCWGLGGDGQTGDGLERLVPRPRASVLGCRAVSMDAGTSHTCAVCQPGEASCWGFNNEGELGSPLARLYEEAPFAVALDGFRDVEAGDFRTCARRLDGTLWCWGHNYYGEIGNGIFVGDQATPSQTRSVAEPTSLAVGGHHTCVADSEGRVFCWGANASGELGIPSSDPSALAVEAMGLGGVVEVAAGMSYTCVRGPGGEVSCWGYNGLGQLGDGTTVSRETPRPVSLERPALALALSTGEFSCALLDDGTARCWGANGSGQLGNGSTEDSPVPVPVMGLADGLLLAAGSRHACAFARDGVIRCWGDNSHGQLGDGTTEPRLTPTPVDLQCP